MSARTTRPLLLFACSIVALTTPLAAAMSAPAGALRLALFAPDTTAAPAMNIATTSAITSGPATAAATGSVAAAAAAPLSGHLQLANDRLRLTWRRTPEGWRLDAAQARAASPADSPWLPLPAPDGRHTILYCPRQPAANLVELDREGTAYPFYPDNAVVHSGPDGASTLVFRRTLPVGEAVSEWTLDPAYPADIRVRLTLVPARPGWFALPTPTLAVLDPADIAWGMVPGNWYGNALQPDFELSPAYSQGIPSRPFLAGERNTMTLCPLMETTAGLTLAVIPAPGSAAHPWEHDKNTRDRQHLALALMDRYGQPTPLACSPVLGREGSRVEPDETGNGNKSGTLSFEFRYTLAATPWFEVFRHAAADIYRFSGILELQTSRESLATRLARLHALLRDDRQSAWKTLTLPDGALIGSNGAKTSDIAAMWMLARVADDPVLARRLPFLRAFKLAQQQTAPGFFQHAATGEYPDPLTGRFTAERGNWIEPLFTTYYTLQDMGNMALFEPADATLRERIRLAAEKLLSWQRPDGSWPVAFDSISHRPDFTRLRDLRPTWYGLLVAWRILGQDAYLASARRGADWFLENAVAPGHFLGACGDALNIWDFTTAFAAQALLDLHAATGDTRYRDAAIRTAQIYATTIFTHPIPTREKKHAGNTPREDWELTQTGLNVEHIRGTAMGGPILLGSHAPLFVRIHELTADTLFLDMARAAARGRHHFVNPATGLSAYYWHTLGHPSAAFALFPWHAEWQVGWITDYLLAETGLRSGGKITFPAGFATPKVGPHLARGFAPGKIHGQPVELWFDAGAVTCDNPDIEHLCAFAPGSVPPAVVPPAAASPAAAASGRELFLMILNQTPRPQTPVVRTDSTRTVRGHPLRWTRARVIQGRIHSAEPATGELRLELPPWGLAVVALTL
ncbi:MAG: glycoside hydrolase family 88 protein [Opitutaceae bacterium]|jgi:hypothetical protein|nr:glycoside hydrolase family 88 protein [Opitutaceae bacterium]